MDRRGVSLQPFHIPTSCRQPRTHGSRPRPSPSGGCKEGCINAIISTCDDVIDDPVTAQVKENMISVQYSLGLDAAQLQGAEVEPTLENSLFVEYNSRSADSYLSPGSVVWAKIGFHEWWPAEVMDRQAALECNNDVWDEKLVLIQLYGVSKLAWVDPVRSLSQFDYCYEERSRDTSKAFQDALNQALRRKESTSSSEQSDENSGRMTYLNCQRASDGLMNESNAKRRSKPKIRFEDLTFPDNSARKMRRMKIMRHLGLSAPVGSPFSRPHGRRRHL